MINVRVYDRELRAIPLYSITSGCVGLPAKFTFDSDWDGLTRTAKFRHGDTSAEVELETDECPVPATVLATPGGDLWIGVYGTDGNGKVAIPTVWGKAGHIYDGVTPAGE